MSTGTIEIDGEVVSETADAYHFTDSDVTVWLPKSQCEWDQDRKEMTMPEWLAMDRGLI